MIEYKGRYEGPVVFFKIKPNIKKICYNLNNAKVLYFVGKIEWFLMKMLFRLTYSGFIIVVLSELVNTNIKKLFLFIIW